MHRTGGLGRIRTGALQGPGDIIAGISPQDKLTLVPADLNVSKLSLLDGTCCHS